MSWWVALGIMAIVGGASFAQTVSGFGFSLLAVPLMSLLTSGTRAVVIAALVGFPQTVIVALRNRSSIEARVVAIIVGASALGMPLGLLVTTGVSDRALKIVIGTMVAALATALAAGFRLKTTSRWIDGAAGFVSGVLSTSTGTTGPPLVIALHARHLSPRQLRSTLAATFAIAGVVTLVLFVARGRVHGTEVRYAALGIPCVLAGLRLGVAAHPHIDERRFGHVVVGLLYLSATVAIVAALTR